MFSVAHPMLSKFKSPRMYLLWKMQLNEDHFLLSHTFLLQMHLLYILEKQVKKVILLIFIDLSCFHILFCFFFGVGGCIDISVVSSDNTVC